MAKVRAFIRIGKKGTKFTIDASAKEKTAPLTKPVGYRGEKEYLPTVAFAVDLVIPDEFFSKAAKVIAELNVAASDMVIAASIPVPKPHKDK